MATKSIGKGWRLDKNGKLLKVPVYANVCQRIKAKKKPKIKVVAAR